MKDFEQKSAQTSEFVTRTFILAVGFPIALTEVPKPILASQKTKVVLLGEEILIDIPPELLGYTVHRIDVCIQDNGVVIARLLTKLRTIEQILDLEAAKRLLAKVSLEVI